MADANKVSSSSSLKEVLLRQDDVVAFFLKGYQDFFCITLTFPNEKLPFTPIHKKVTFDQLYLVPKIPKKFKSVETLKWSFGLKGWPLMTTSFVGPFSAPFLDIIDASSIS